MIGNLWPVFAAMDGVAATDGTTRKDGIDEFPDESPTDKQMSDWLDAVDPHYINQWALRHSGCGPPGFTLSESAGLTQCRQCTGTLSVDPPSSP